MEPVVEFCGVAKDFGRDWRGRRVRALADITLQVGPGRVAAVVGPNGSGKSTLLRLAAGLTHPTDGTVRRRGMVGYLPESCAFPAALGVREFLTTLAEVGGSTAACAEVGTQLVALGLVEVAETPLGRLSKGQRQRVGIAQAGLGSPALVLLDEPADGLDPRALALLGDFIHALRRSGAAVIFTTHLLQHAELLADDFIFLERGRLVRNVPREETLAAGGVEKLYLEVIRT